MQELRDCGLAAAIQGADGGPDIRYCRTACGGRYNVAFAAHALSQIAHFAKDLASDPQGEFPMNGGAMSSEERLSSDRDAALVREYLRTMLEEPGSALGAVQELVGSVLEAGSEVWPALVDAMSDNDPKIRVAAAWFLREFCTQIPGVFVERDWFDAAEQVLVSAAKSKERNEWLPAAIVLSLGSVPDAAIPILKRRIRQGPAEQRVFFAAALSNTNAALGGTIHVLSAGLTDENPAVRLMAAAAFGRLAMRPPAMQHVVDLLRKGNEVVVFAVLFALKQVGAPGKLVAPAVIELIEKGELAPETCQLALAVVGSLTRESDQGYPTLKNGLLSSDAKRLLGAAEGLAFLEALPDEAVAILTGRLTEGSPEIRWAAAHGLRSIGPRAAKAMPNLIEQARRETVVEVFGAISVGMEVIAPAAIPQLIEALISENGKASDLAAVVLSSAGVEAAEAIGRLCLSQRDNRVRRIAVRLLREMGPAAAPAVAALAVLLDEADDDHVAVQIIATIQGCGPAAKGAVTALVRRLASRTTDVAEWAATTLRIIGPDAVPDLVAARNSSGADGQRRIDELLKFLQPSGDELLAEFSGIDPQLLEVFIAVGDVLERGPTGWREVSTRIEDEVTAGRCKLGRFSASKLRLDMATLSDALGVELTNREDKRKSYLTAEGIALLAKAKRFRLISRKR